MLEKDLIDKTKAINIGASKAEELSNLQDEAIEMRNQLEETKKILAREQGKNKSLKRNHEVESKTFLNLLVFLSFICL